MKSFEKEYARRVREASPPSPKVKNFLCAYTIGGTICLIGQLLREGYTATGLSEKSVGMAVSCTLIFAAALLTGLGIFDRIAKHAGAGTLVPITGFANATVAPAMEYRAEGFIAGMGTKIFTVAGPVILYGTLASVAYGILYWLYTLL